MSGSAPDQAQEDNSNDPDDVAPGAAGSLVPLVGLGGSAGAIEALQAFFAKLPVDSGLAFAIVVHLSTERESGMPDVLRRCTKMEVVEVSAPVKVAANTVYLIPARFGLKVADGTISTTDLPPGRGSHFGVDIFFRTLADTYGPHSAAIVLSGTDGDGAVGIKRVKERGGLTIAQDPDEAGQGGMPRSSIGTGMVDWVLPAGDIPARLLEYFGRQGRLKLPPEKPPQSGIDDSAARDDEAVLREVLTFLRTRTGRDFTSYKRATILRRIARRMQVNGIEDIHDYLDCLRTNPGESQALLQDLLISVTNFFRDADCFQALDGEIASIFASKAPGEALRVWVVACATGEEAYSIAMLLTDHARKLNLDVPIQIFATDLDAEAVRFARDAVYPTPIEADVSEERLRRYFTKEHLGYRVRREIREMVLFAVHDVLKDSPFSRIDLISCRNLLIYLNADAQRRVLDTFHFALLPGGRLFLGSSESVDELSPQFKVLDKKHRLFEQRPTSRVGLPLPIGATSLALAVEAQRSAMDGPVVAGNAFRPPVPAGLAAPADSRPGSWGDVHLRLLEMLAPPSILVDREYDIVHLSQSAGHFLQFAAGEPTRDLLKCVSPALRIELRAALFKAAQSRAPAEVPPTLVEVGGAKVLLTVRVLPVHDSAFELFLVMFQQTTPQPGEVRLEVLPPGSEADPVARHLDRELERLKAHLRDTVEQYEASAEELKASNEELQAMNEELRSATEELETSREELQSINEELTTVNHELKHKVDELGHANSDMHNLMDATAIATVFLDRDLRITLYTPSAVPLFNFIPSDVGRPLSDLKTPLEYPELGADASRVLQRLAPVEREVRRGDGNWYFARLLPYRTIEDRIAGVVLTFVDVTERKRADEVRSWLSSVVAASSDGIISFALDGTILSWNNGAQRIFGYSAEEAIGKPLGILSPPVSPDQYTLVARVAAGEVVENEEELRRRKDGTELHVSLTLSPIRDEGGRVMAGTAMARDVSAAKAAEEALRASEERLRLLIENATEFAIFSLDLERRVTTWNAGAQRLLGYAESEVLGRTADIIFTPEDRAAGMPENETETALAEGRASDDRFHVRKDGSRFWASGAAMRMLNASGEAVGFVKILRDQTAARDSREALERSSAELLRVLADNERARAELQAADIAKDRFLAILSHELRNPVASIDSAAEILLSGSAGEGDRRAGALIVQRQARAMKALLDDLLDVSRLKLGRLELHRELTPLSTIVQSAVDATRPLLVAAGHRLNVDMPPQEIEVDGDPLRLGQVVSNLLANAARYTPDAGTIDLSAKVQAGQVAITVKDNGVGIAPDEIESLFGMFTQASSGSARGHGLGIGLALVKNLVELHGGHVSAHSEGQGKGSEFTVTLPIARERAGSPKPSRPAATPPPPAPVPGGARKGTILVADDNVDAGWGMAKLLELAGYQTVRVRGGTDAIEEITRNPPDAAIIDIGMPDLGGHEVARRVRSTKAGKNVVLIAATGWGQEGDVREALAAGFDAHMTKPLELGQLVKVIDELGAKRRKR